MALSLSRNAKFVVSDGTNTQEIGILDGFSFSQSTGTQSVTTNEAGDSPKRGQQVFNTSLEPVDWSFTTYARPLNDGATDTAVEKILWNALVAKTVDEGITEGVSSMAISFSASNTNQLLELDGFFRFTDSLDVYHLTKMVVNSASIDFDIDGIAQISWSGFASSVVSGTTATASYDLLTVTPIPAAADFILNRISTVGIVSAETVGGLGVTPIVTGTLALTGGNITIENGIAYVTPETLGVVNLPVGHQTGSRTVSGNLTCYLDGTGKDVYNAVLEDINSGDPEVTNSYSITVKIGGTGTPNVYFALGTAHLELPSIDTSDVMGVTLNFTALESVFGTGNDEATITYNPIQPA